MDGLYSIEDLKRRALDLKDINTKMVLLSTDRKFYFEIDFRRQITVISSDFGIDYGKNLLMRNLEAIVTNDGYADIQSRWLSNGLSELVCVDKPSHMPKALEGRHIFFIGRGDMMNQQEADIINDYIEKRNTIVIFARCPSLLMSDTPSVVGEFKVEMIGGMSCIFIH